MGKLFFRGLLQGGQPSLDDEYLHNLLLRNGSCEFPQPVVDEVTSFVRDLGGMKKSSEP